MKCSIVIATYNRKELFQRTLNNILSADYSGYEDISLIISIDRADNCQEMKRIADLFVWQYGHKEVILHEKRLGLRKHFIFCGSLSQQYGPVIFLEDDVFVSKNYYHIAQVMTDYYINDNRVVGVSLYSFLFNESARRPFVPLNDGSDVYFCSLMSWAPVYFPKQWNDYFKWLEKLNGEEIIFDDIPDNVKAWGKSSFKKLHIQYMASQKKYFAYSRVSCATNFSEPGEHYKKDTNILQVPLEVGRRESIVLKPIDESLCVYDVFLELEPERLKRLQPILKSYDFDTDLFGRKGVNNLHRPYILTTKNTRNSILKFGRKMTPQELNVIYDIPGNEIKLSKREDVTKKQGGIKKYINDVLYDLKGASVLKILISDIIWSYMALKSRINK